MNHINSGETENFHFDKILISRFFLFECALLRAVKPSYGRRATDKDKVLEVWHIRPHEISLSKLVV
jgi:hypothetical protein